MHNISFIKNMTENVSQASKFIILQRTVQQKDRCPF